MSIKKSAIIFPFHHWLKKSLFNSIQHWYCAQYYCVLFCRYWLYKYIVVYVIKSGVYKTELGKKVPQNNQRNRSCCKPTHTRQTTTHKYLTTNLCFVPVPFVVYCVYYYYYYALVLVVPIITCFHQAQAGRSRWRKRRSFWLSWHGEALPTRKEANNKDDQRCILWSSSTCALS